MDTLVEMDFVEEESCPNDQCCLLTVDTKKLSQLAHKRKRSRVVFFNSGESVQLRLHARHHRPEKMEK